jgi:RND family efflux transporter MFP subunit
MRRMIATLGAILAIASCSQKTGVPPPAPPPKAVEVLTLAPSEVREAAEYLGTLSSRESVTVMPQVAGYVRSIHVRPGQKVEAGAPLIEIDARQETAAVDSAKAQGESATARLALARQTRTRAEALYKEGLASAEEIERSRAEEAAAEAASRAAQAEVSQRQVQLQFHVVRAAVPGVAGDVLVRLGDFVATSKPLTNIAQSDVLELSVAIPAVRARSIVIDQTPIELLDENGKPMLETKVFFVAPEANPRTQLVEVKAVFQNTVGLRPSVF